MAPLRILLWRCGVPYHAEMTIGSSYEAFRGLDAYIRVAGSGIQTSVEEAHFLLNTGMPPDERMLLKPEDWWQCKALVSVGQKPLVSEWSVDLTPAVVSPKEDEFWLRRRMFALMAWCGRRHI